MQLIHSDQRITALSSTLSPILDKQGEAISSTNFQLRLERYNYVKHNHQFYMSKEMRY